MKLLISTRERSRHHWSQWKSNSRLSTQHETIHTTLAQLDTRSGEISDQRVTIEASIHDTIRRLHEILVLRKTELIGQLHKMIQRKIKNIASQRDQIETIQAQINRCIQFVTDSLKTGSQGEVLKMYNQMIGGVQEEANEPNDRWFLIRPYIIIYHGNSVFCDSKSIDKKVKCW